MSGGLNTNPSTHKIVKKSKLIFPLETEWGEEQEENMNVIKEYEMEEEEEEKTRTRDLTRTRNLRQGWLIVRIPRWGPSRRAIGPIVPSGSDTRRIGQQRSSERERMCLFHCLFLL